jgi:hypothetical protein
MAQEMSEIPVPGSPRGCAGYLGLGEEIRL